MLLYPCMTALDFVGPQYGIAGLKGGTVHRVTTRRLPTGRGFGKLAIRSRFHTAAAIGCLHDGARTTGIRACSYPSAILPV